MQDSLSRLTLLLGGLAMLGPFATDTYLPSFPAISSEFGIGALGVQQTLSVYLGSAFKLAAGASAGLLLAAIFWSLGTRQEMVCESLPAYCLESCLQPHAEVSI
jgi:hypothetical protein